MALRRLSGADVTQIRNDRLAASAAVMLLCAGGRSEVLIASSTGEYACAATR